MSARRRIRDLSLAEFQAMYPPMLGGDPASSVSDATQTRLRELSEQIASASQQATQAYDHFNRTREAVVQDAAAASDPNSEAFRAADTASKAYSTAAEQVSNLRTARERLLEMSGHRPPQGDPQATNGGGPTGFTVGDTLLDAIRAQAGARALRSDDYRELVARGAFHVTGRKSVEGVLLRRSGVNRETGENDSREALLAALESGDMGRMATLVTGGAGGGGTLTQPDRQPGIVPLRTRPLRLVDLITVGRTDSDEVSYVEMTGFTNAAAETAEATATTGTSGTKPESALVLAERSTTVRTVAHWIPATKKALSDSGQLRTLIDQILRLGLDLRLDQQIATGDGVGENLRGIYNTAGIAAIQRRAAAAGNTNTPETVLDVLHRGITTTRLAFFEPNAIGIHPLDFELIRLARGTAAVPNTATVAGSFGSGDYLMGEPISGDRVTIWGLTPVVSAAFTQGLPIVGDFAQIVMWLREGTQVLASDSHMDFFVRNMVAILAEFRAALGVLAPAAFATVNLTAA